MKTSYAIIDQDHPILKKYRLSDMTGTCSLVGLGLECPFGADFMEIVKKVKIPRGPMDWVFIVRDEKKWLINKIKYSI